MEWRTIISNSWVAAVLIFAVNFALKIWTADYASLYLDEAVSVFYAQQDLGALMEYATRDANPPLHFLTLHYWIKLFGVSEFSVRGLSVLFSSGTAVMLWVLLKRFSNTTVAWTAVILFTFSNVHLLYAQEARGFAMVAFFATASFWFYLRLFQDRKKWAAVGLFACNAALLATHYAALFVPLVQVLALVFWWDRERKYFGFWGLAQVLTVGALLQEWLALSGEKVGNNANWLPSPNAIQATELMERFSGNDMMLYLVAVILAIGIVFWAIKQQRFSRLFGVATLWCFGTLIGAWVLSLWVPLFLPKYLLYASVGMVIMIALTLGAVPFKRPTQLVIIAVVIGFSLSQFKWEQAKQEDWKGAVAWAYGKQQDGAILMTAVYNFRAFAYHFNESVFTDYENTQMGLYEEQIFCADELHQEFFKYQPYERFVLVEAHEKDLPADRSPFKVLEAKFDLLEQTNFQGIRLTVFGRRSD
jgi:mannosyltransferase